MKSQREVAGRETAMCDLTHIGGVFVNSKSQCVIPKADVLQPGEGSRGQQRRPAQDPVRLLPFSQSLRAGSSLRLKYGFAHDDALTNIQPHRNIGSVPNPPEVREWKS